MPIGSSAMCFGPPCLPSCGVVVKHRQPALHAEHYNLPTVSCPICSRPRLIVSYVQSRVRPACSKTAGQTKAMANSSDNLQRKMGVGWASWLVILPRMREILRSLAGEKHSRGSISTGKLAGTTKQPNARGLPLSGSAWLARARARREGVIASQKARAGLLQREGLSDVGKLAERRNIGRTGTIARIPRAFGLRPRQPTAQVGEVNCSVVGWCLSVYLASDAALADSVSGLVLMGLASILSRPKFAAIRTYAYGYSE